MSNMTFIEPHIGRRHVPMDKAVLMQIGQTTAELASETENVLE
jgi:hypothetical protein